MSAFLPIRLLLRGDSSSGSAGEISRQASTTAPYPAADRRWGERVTLRQVAHYADIANFGAHSVMGGAYHIDDVVHKYDVLRSHCEAEARPYDSVLRSHLTFPLVLAETHEALRAKLDRLPQGWLKMFGSSLIAGVPQEVINLLSGSDLCGRPVLYLCILSQ